MMSHYAVCGENERIKKHVSKEPAPDSCACKSHQIEAKRMSTNPTYIPKWKSSGTACIAIKHKCLFSDYEEREKLVSPKFDSAQNI